jgi:MATE family multidrug resistance protein
MFSFRKFLKGHLEGDGGVKDVWAIALPMVLSSGFETFVMFLDRLMLSKVSPVQMAAMLSGGLTSFTLMTFFMGLIGYSSAIIAHLYGAGRKADCAKMASQAFLVSVISYPIMLFLLPLGYASFAFAGHSAAQIAFEKKYITISIFATSLFALLKVPLASFFAGTGKTRQVMFANLVGLAVNILVAYALIFGRFGFPSLEIRGAAIAVAVSAFANFATLLFFYLRRSNTAEFDVASSFVFKKDMMSKLLRFGFPSGLEFLINMSAFTAMISMFHGYGETVASAVTIAFSWDMVSFVPMVGLQVAVMTLVGQNLGRKNEAEAIRSAYSGFKIVFMYSGLMMLLFLLMPSFLAGIFRPDNCAGWEEIRRITVPMIMMMSVYPISDGVFIIFAGAVRGAGDTRWAMTASAILHWTAALITWFVTKNLQLPPLIAWGFFVVCFPMLGLTFWLRFRSGKWRGREVLPSEMPPGPTGDIEPNPLYIAE